MAIKLSASDALAYAQASQRIEGLEMSAEAIELIRRMLEGATTYEQAVAEIVKSAKRNAGAGSGRIDECK